VTKDPETFNNPKNENPGIVTSDSLAGESIQSGGSFAANSDARGAMGQPSASTTTNTTDTSSATVIEGKKEQDFSDVPGTVGGGKASGVGPTYNTAAGGGASSGGVSGQSENTAPGYASHPAPSVSVGGNATYQPKGKDLKEGEGFTGNEENASFTTDIGGKNDPGRAALQGLQERDVPVSGGAGSRLQAAKGVGEEGGQFGGLDEASA
jgi:hypothetical protein